MNNKILIAFGILMIVGIGGYVLMGSQTETSQMEADKTTAPEEKSEYMMEQTTTDKTIVDVAQEAGNFKTLIAAVQAAGLVETLQSEGPFTVFAPTDEAFAALPAGTVEELLKPENNDQLVSILTYHVVPGKVMAADVITIPSATTVQGSDVMIDASTGDVMINNATVTTADIQASNGVIHVIDTVLMPQ